MPNLKSLTLSIVSALAIAGVINVPVAFSISNNNVQQNSFVPWTAQHKLIASKIVTNKEAGASTEIYTLGGSEELMINAPPISFDPLTATPAELRDFGFPDRPTNNGALKLWMNAMSVHLEDISKNVSLIQEPLSNFVNVGVKDQSTYVNTNWGGFDAKGAANTFTGVAGMFNVPAVTNSAACPNPYFSIWSGLGGAKGSNSLIQSGLIYNLNAVINPTSADWSSFIEFLNGSSNHGPVDLIALVGSTWKVHAGDEMLTQTTYTATNRGTASFYLEDVTSGQYASYSVIGVSAYYDGTSAETIQESHLSFPFDSSPVHWTYVSQATGGPSTWAPLLSAPATDKFFGIYSSPSTLSSTSDTSYTMTKNGGC